MGHTQGNPSEDNTANIPNGDCKEMIDFEDDPLLHILPSFNQMLHKKVTRRRTPICGLGHPQIEHSNQPNQSKQCSLADFVKVATEEDRQFVVFPYNLSEHSSLEELPMVVDNGQMLPEEVNDWLQYFPQAKPWGC